MNILSESLLSNTQEQCHNCEYYEKEFAVLKKKLALSYASFIWLENLETIRGQMQSIQSVAKENKIGLQDLAAGLNYSLDKLFSCKNKEIVDRGKKVIDLIFELFNKISENSTMQKEKSMRKEQSPKRREVEVGEKTQKKQINGRYETKRQPLKQQERKTQRLEQIHQYLNSSLDKKQESKVEKDSFSIVQSSRNESNSRTNHNHSYDDICLPLIWEETSQFNNNGKTITKLHDSEYKKICTEMPLPSTGIHKIKFQMVNAGTVAFGIVPKGLKFGKFFDNKKAIKYLTFENGGGLVKECNDQIVEGKKVHIAEGEVLEIVYKADQRELVYRNKKMGEVVVEIDKHPLFKNKEVYFFLQMKQENTKIKIL